MLWGFAFVRPHRYGAYPYDWQYSADIFLTNSYGNLIIYNPREAEAAFLSFDLTELKVTYVPSPPPGRSS